MKAAANPVRKSGLQGAMLSYRQAFIPGLWSAMLIGGLATLSYYLLAKFRYLLYPLSLPTRSDSNTLAIAALLLFTLPVHVCLTYLGHWLQAAIGFRLTQQLAVPAILADAADQEGAAWGRSAALRDVEEVAGCIAGPIFTAIVDIALVPLLILLLATTHWSILLFALAAGAIKITLSLVTYRATSAALKACNASQMRAVAGIGDAANCAEAVEAMGFLRALARRFADDIHGGLDQMMRVRRSLRLLQTIAFALDTLMMAAPVVMMMMLDWNGISTGMDAWYGMIAMMVMPRVAGPFTQLLGMSSEFGAGLQAWERLQALARKQDALPQGQAFLCPHGRMEVDRLTVLLPGMSYPIIRDLTFRIEPGQVIGLSGPVGCGKSTLLRALIGIQRPLSGGCYLDGHATWQWERTDFARYVGFLPQEVGLADGTLADAIARLGPPDMALVLEAAHRSGAHRFIVELPRGYSTKLSEHGLSAGQRQRLALARAIYGRPRLLILDEPGAWLDTEGQAELRRMIQLLKQDGTAILFTSHEPGLLEAADHNITLGMPGVLPRASSRNRLPAPQAVAS